MDKDKMNKIGIVAFIAFIMIFASFSGYVFFNNSSNLAISIRSNTEQLKRDVAVTEALTKSLVHKNDTIKFLGTKMDQIIKLKAQDSISKNTQIKKLTHEKDSLLNLIRTYKWSDIEPVNSKQSK